MLLTNLPIWSIRVILLTINDNCNHTFGHIVFYPPVQTFNQTQHGLRSSSANESNLLLTPAFKRNYYYLSFVIQLNGKQFGHAWSQTQHQIVPGKELNKHTHTLTHKNWSTQLIMHMQARTSIRNKSLIIKNWPWVSACVPASAHRIGCMPWLYNAVICTRVWWWAACVLAYLFDDTHSYQRLNELFAIGFMRKHALFIQRVFIIMFTVNPPSVHFQQPTPLGVSIITLIYYQLWWAGW